MKKKPAKETVDHRNKDFLTEAEIKRFLEAARHGRHGVRDYVMMLMAYRHGLRVSELVDIRLKDLDLESARLYVRRKKGSLSTHQPIEGDELRAIRAWLRERSCAFTFTPICCGIQLDIMAQQEGSCDKT